MSIAIFPDIYGAHNRNTDWIGVLDAYRDEGNLNDVDIAKILIQHIKDGTQAGALLFKYMEQKNLTCVDVGVTPGTLCRLYNTTPIKK